MIADARTPSEALDYSVLVWLLSYDDQKDVANAWSLDAWLTEALHAWAF